MSDLLHTASSFPRYNEKASLVSFPVRPDGDSFDINVSGQNGDSVVANTNQRVTMPKNQTTLQENFLQLHMRQDNARVAIRSGRKVLLLNPHDVVTVVAQGNYALLRRQTDSHLVREKISSIAEKLKRYGFIQIHRSVVVNRLYVEEIRALPTGEYVLRIKGGREYTVTRTYKRMLTTLADVWVGRDSFTAAS
jgi:DNA-binding LytR/AlgR family response regulator